MWLEEGRRTCVVTRVFISKPYRPYALTETAVGKLPPLRSMVMEG
jgi:hypothetical protein